MKNVFLKISVLFFALGIAFGCHEHEVTLPALPHISIAFESDRVAVREDKVHEIIKLLFDAASRIDGTVTLSIGDADQERFITEPAAVNGLISLNILKGQELATVKITPVNNSTFDGNTEIVLAISTLSDGFRFGAKKSLTVTLVDDEGPVTLPAEPIVNFVPAEGKISEFDQEGQTLTIQLSEALQSEGSIEITVESANADYDTHFVTIPAIVGGKITLNPSVGVRVTSVTIVPINNTLITGDFEISLTIANTSGPIKMGTALTEIVTISDDELINKPKGYEVTAGSWGLKKIYEYDVSGRISKVHIEKSTPAKSTHTETYFYNASGQVERINTYPQINTVFTWTIDRITKSETVDNGVVKAYTDYDYDVQGNVSGTANYYRQVDGQYKLGSLIVYLYSSDGNLYKSLYYLPTEGTDDYTLISTRTYEGYIAAENPFPMVDILPTVKTQNKLPSSYRVQENGVDLLYAFSYEFRNDGLVSKRTSTNAQTSETAAYLYY
jgi:hypothetical protein